MRLSEFSSEDKILGESIPITPLPPSSNILSKADKLKQSVKRVQPVSPSTDAAKLTNPAVKLDIKNKPTDENFADGRHPEDKGDSKRHHVPTKSSVSNLRKFAKSHSGRAAQLAHWMANMKSGKKKK